MRTRHRIVYSEPIGLELMQTVALSHRAICEVEAGLYGRGSLGDHQCLGGVEREVCELEDIYHDRRGIIVCDPCEDGCIHEPIERGDLHVPITTGRPMYKCRNMTERPKLRWTAHWTRKRN